MRNKGLLIGILLLLCSAIMFGVARHIPRLPEITVVLFQQITERCAMVRIVSKDVFIHYQSTHPNEFLVLVDLRNVGSSYDSFYNKVQLQSLWNQFWDNGTNFIEEVNTSRFLIAITDLQFCLQADHSRWRLTKISKSYAASPIVIWDEIDRFGKVVTFYQNPSAFSIYGSIGASLRRVRSFLSSLKRSYQNPKLQYTDYEQQSVGNPTLPIKVIFPYRHGGKFSDSYGLICIFIVLLSSIGICGWGLFLACDLRRRIGWLLFIVGLILGFLAVTSGSVGCLPWDWRRCLNDGQDHSEKYGSHIEAAL